MNKRDIIGSIDYKNIYMVLALKRSGHHAISNWLCQQTHKDSLYWDQCQSRRDERRLVPVGGAVYHDGGGGDKPKYYWMPQDRKHRKPTFDEIKYSSVDNCFISIETFGYAQDDRISSLKDILRIDNITPSHIVIINRDFYNWMASCIVVGGRPYDRRHTMAKIWKEFVRESLAPDILKGYNVVDINYNRWFADTDYRKETCSRLGLTFTDKGLNDMLRSSTFDMWKYRNRAQEMDVLNRYRLCLNNEDYLNLMDDEIRDLSEKYFGFVPKELAR